MKHLFLFIALLAVVTGYSQRATRGELLGMWHLDKMIQDSVCVFDVDDSTVLIKQVFGYSRRVNQHLTGEDSIKILQHCHKKATDMRQVFIRFIKDGSCENRHMKPGVDGGLTDSIEKGNYVFDVKQQTLQYSGSPKMDVQIIKHHLNLSFVLALSAKHHVITMEYVKW